MGVWYAFPRDVKSALSDNTAADKAHDAQVSRALESASRQAEALLRRRFYPVVTTRQFDWPDRSSPTSWRLWVDSDQGEPISLTAVTTTNGAVTLNPSSYFLRRSDNGTDAPYDQLQVDLSSSGVFASGGTRQRSLGLTGIFGYDLATVPAGATAEALDGTETDVDVTDSSETPVGCVLTVDSERLLVTGASWLTTGQTVQAQNMTALPSNASFTVTSGAALHAGETVLIDSEKMLITDIAGNTIVVKRAQEGTVLATHSIGATVYAPRTLTVTRGALGTTAATHLTAASLVRQTYPGPVVALTVAYAINNLLQEGGGYARTAGQGENAREFSGRGIVALEQDALAGYGRQVQSGAI